jgi:hypothetical protein
MWLLSPAIRDYLDPAVDYAWDWNTPGGVPGDGAAPSPERAAQMMRDLFAPRPAQEQAAIPPAPEGDSQPDEAPAPPETAPLATTTDAHIKEAECDKSISNQSDTNDMIPRRRHGGALPS